MQATFAAFKACALTTGGDSRTRTHVEFESEDLHVLRDVLYKNLPQSNKQQALNWLATGGRTYQTLIAFLQGESVHLRDGSESWAMMTPTGREPAGPKSGVRTSLSSFKESAHVATSGARTASNGVDWAFDANSLKALQRMFGGLCRSDKDQAINWMATGGNRWMSLINFLQGGRLWLHRGQSW